MIDLLYTLSVILPSVSMHNKVTLSLDRYAGKVCSDRPRIRPSNYEKNSAAESIRNEGSSRARVTIIRSEVSKCEYKKR